MKLPELTLRDYVEKKLKELKKIRKFKLGEELWNTLYNLSVDYNLKAYNNMNMVSEEAQRSIEAKLSDIFNHYPYKKDKKRIELEDYIEFKVKYGSTDKVFCLLKTEGDLMVCYQKGKSPTEGNAKYLVRRVELFFEKGEWIKIKQEGEK